MLPKPLNSSAMSSPKLSNASAMSSPKWSKLSLRLSATRLPTSPHRRIFFPIVSPRLLTRLPHETFTRRVTHTVESLIPFTPLASTLEDFFTTIPAILVPPAATSRATSAPVPATSRAMSAPLPATPRAVSVTFEPALINMPVVAVAVLAIALTANLGTPGMTPARSMAVASRN